MSDLARIFSDIYATQHWGHYEGSISGYGSSKNWTRNISETLPALAAELGAKSLLDAGCGDYNWMSAVQFPGIRILACDVAYNILHRARARYGHLARFFVADITTDSLPKVDLILCRTVLFHLCFENILKAIRNMVLSKSRWLLLTSHFNVEENMDIADGDFRRVDLTKSPISLPQPQRILADGPTDDGKLALWNTEDLSQWMLTR